MADEMAQQLLRPSALQQGLRSGLFLSGVRRTGKTTFLRQDLIPALEARGAVVIYVDLWSDALASPSQLLHAAVRAKLVELQDPFSTAFGVLKKIASAEVATHGLKFKFDLAKLGDKNGATLADVFADVVKQAATDLVLIVDEAQHCLSSEDGLAMMLALKAARDAINLSPNPPGHFVFIGTGSNRALVQELSARRNMAFQGAQSVDYPVLGEDYVANLLEALRLQGARSLPSHGITTRAFRDLGSRPEELLRALSALSRALHPGVDPDTVLPVLVAAAREGFANGELVRIEDLGALAEAIFDRIAESAESETRGLYAVEAMAKYSKQLGRAVTTEEVQAVIQQIQTANLIMRTGRGAYAVVDSFLRDIWLERKRVLAPPSQPPGE